MNIRSDSRTSLAVQALVRVVGRIMPLRRPSKITSAPATHVAFAPHRAYKRHPWVNGKPDWSQLR